jgi:hypothetical protein
MPSDFSPNAKLSVLGAFVVLANLPDAPLPYWGHARYDISHSVFVTTLGVAILATLATGVARMMNTSARRSILLGGAAAWYSHLLLDTFYGHGKGLALLWPVSDMRLALPVPLFATMQLSPLFCMHNLRVFAIEAVTYGTVMCIAVFVRYRRCAFTSPTNHA